jgi:hypothetical protein
MKITKEKLLEFLETEVLIPAEKHPKVTNKILQKISGTRMWLNKLESAEKIEKFFWSAMVSDKGINSYNLISRIGSKTFEDVRAEFKKLCGR